MPREGQGETYTTDILTYAIDNRVVVPDYATAGEHSRLRRLHSVSLIYKHPLVSEASRNAQHNTSSLIAITKSAPDVLVVSQPTCPNGLSPLDAPLLHDL